MDLRRVRALEGVVMMVTWWRREAKRVAISHRGIM